MSLPSCANVRGFYNSDVPLGAERTGSRLWIERRLIYTSQIGSVVRAVAAGPADGEWEATRMQAPLLIEDGVWKTTVPTGIASQYLEVAHQLTQVYRRRVVAPLRPVDLTV